MTTGRGNSSESRTGKISAQKWKQKLWKVTQKGHKPAKRFDESRHATCRDDAMRHDWMRTAHIKHEENKGDFYLQNSMKYTGPPIREGHDRWRAAKHSCHWLFYMIFLTGLHNVESISTWDPTLPWFIFFFNFSSADFNKKFTNPTFSFSPSESSVYVITIVVTCTYKLECTRKLNTSQKR